MRKSKLIALLRDLNTRERTKFREMVFSPFFNKNKKVQKLTDYILRYAPDFEDAALEKAKAHKRIFPRQPFKELSFNNILSDILHLLYHFLSYKNFSNKERLQSNFLIEQLLDRDLDKHFDMNNKKANGLYQKETIRSFKYYHDLYSFKDIQDRHFITLGKRIYDSGLQTKSDALDIYYFINKLRIACDMASRNTVIKANYTCHFLDEIRDYINTHPEHTKDIAVIRIYLKTLEMLENQEEEKYYMELKVILAENLSLFPQEELRILYDYIRNFCIKKINQGVIKYYREILDVYKIILYNKIIFKNNYLTQWDYKNIVTVGIRLQEYDWTKQFIKDYKNSLLPREQNNAYAYNMAILNYAQNNFQEAIFLLQNIEFTDMSYHLGAKSIQLQSYYELGESEAFHFLTDAFKAYLMRNRKLSDYRKLTYFNFIKIVKKVFQLKDAQAILSDKAFQTKKKKVKALVDNTKPLPNTPWLYQKLKEM